MSVLVAIPTSYTPTLARAQWVISAHRLYNTSVLTQDKSPLKGYEHDFSGGYRVRFLGSDVVLKLEVSGRNACVGKLFGLVPPTVSGPIITAALIVSTNGSQSAWTNGVSQNLQILYSCSALPWGQIRSAYNPGVVGVGIDDGSEMEHNGDDKI
jgi:hypothetical protein